MLSFHLIPATLIATALLCAGCNIDNASLPSPGVVYLHDDAYYCHLHDKPLRQGIIPIEYGLLRYDLAMNEAEMLQFPNAGSSSGRGCAWESGCAESSRTWYCRDCRKAEKQWKAKNPDAGAKRPAKDQPGGTAAQVGAWTLLQTDVDRITRGLDHLRHRCAGEFPEFGASEQYIVLLRKLENNWPAFKGWLVGIIEDRVPRRSTPRDLLEREYSLLRLKAEVFHRDRRYSGLYLAAKPLNADLELVWLDPGGHRMLEAEHPVYSVK